MEVVKGSYIFETREMRA